MAVARYDRQKGTDGAEYAALVEDRMQGQGLGFSLTRCLIEAARERGIEHLYALVLPENRGMLRLLQGLDLSGNVRWEDGLELVEISLAGEAA